MKSLKPGLVGMSGGGGSGSPPHVGLIGVVLMTDTNTRLGESWQKMTGGGGGGWFSAMGASTPRIIARPDPQLRRPRAAPLSTALFLARSAPNRRLSAAGSLQTDVSRNPAQRPPKDLSGRRRRAGLDPSPRSSALRSLYSAVQAATEGSNGLPGACGDRKAGRAALSPPK
ncbi:hypothetical protein P7K49_000639 [Saguinus oedipus]|uniref:Uncharacterized protein n=1 Tax=Saguinus oedipus TaxID=9490 RepID=A0ABQ9WCA2_SAGOE|nr:hypothetical protein P7K49_000639 [Saguinus oedipus]